MAPPQYVQFYIKRTLVHKMAPPQYVHFYIKRTLENKLQKIMLGLRGIVLFQPCCEQLVICNDDLVSCHKHI